MEIFRTLLMSYGFTNVSTYIQSGNILLNSDCTPKVIENQISLLLQEKYGYKIPVFVYTRADWMKIIGNCPYQEGERKLYFTFLKDTPNQDATRAYKNENDEFTMIDNVLYLACVSYGKTKLNNTFLEKHFKVSATTRNQNTVMTLWAMLTKP